MAKKRLGVPFVSKKYQKLVARCCRVCKNANQAELDVHRIIEGANGGRYSYDNCVILCSGCHRKQQAGQIKIESWHNSTMGRVLHWFDEEGNEHFS